MREGAYAWQHDALIVGASRTPWFVPIAFTILAKGSVPQAIATIGEIVFLRNLTVKVGTKEQDCLECAGDRISTVRRSSYLSFVHCRKNWPPQTRAAPISLS